MPVYYLIKDKVVQLEREVNSNLYNYYKLNQSQIDFYNNNKTATTDEIKNCSLNIVQKTLTEHKNEKILQLKIQKEQKLNSIISTNDISNSIMGIYSNELSNNIRKTISEYNNIFDTTINLINSATNVTDLDNITYTFPTNILNSDIDFNKSVNIHEQNNLQIDGSNGEFFKINLIENSSFTFSNIKKGIPYNFLIYNTGTVGITIVLPTTDLKIKNDVSLDIGQKNLLLFIKITDTLNIWQVSDILI